VFIAGTDTKIATLEHAVHLLDEARAEDQIIVVTNGVFDLLHLGHVRYLQEARSLGDLLVVGVNDDDSVRRLKGPQRPLVPGSERAVVLAALECIDLVVPFFDDTAERLVSRLRPDIYVKGGDYNPKAGAGEPGYLPEAATVASSGGRVTILPFLPGHSTSELVRNIVERYAAGSSSWS
jgi:D-beta-D-heptose 7-phosphate kinase/D-beta-D-heptose 1-phosphate adenosyltransferase